MSNILLIIVVIGAMYAVLQYNNRNKNLKNQANGHERTGISSSDDAKIAGKQIPSFVHTNLLASEEVKYFSFISFRGGCASSSGREDYWIAITDKRVLYRAEVRDQGSRSSTTKDGLLPLSKVSFVEVTENAERSGCSSKKYFFVELGTSGGTVHIPIPTKEKGYEIRREFVVIQEGSTH